MLESIISEHVLHPHKLCAAASSSHILGLSSRKRSAVLFLAVPRYQVVPNEKAAPGSAFPVISISGPIGVRVSCNLNVSIKIILDAIIRSILDIFNDTFYRLNMRLLGVGLIPSAHPNAESNIWPAGREI